jgi:hypothetical protein
MSTARRYFDEHPDHPCHWSPSTSVTPHTSIVQGYHGLLPACKIGFFADSAARYDLVACRKTQITDRADFAANAADRSIRSSSHPLLHIRGSNCAVLLDSCADAALYSAHSGACTHYSVYFAFWCAASDSCSDGIGWFM